MKIWWNWNLPGYLYPAENCDFQNCIYVPNHFISGSLSCCQSLYIKQRLQNLIKRNIITIYFNFPNHKTKTTTTKTKEHETGVVVVSCWVSFEMPNRSNMLRRLWAEGGGMTAGQRGWRTDVFVSSVIWKAKLDKYASRGGAGHVEGNPLIRNNYHMASYLLYCYYFADISSGSSADWTYGKAGIKFSYGVELRDTGKFGFLLPEDQILPSGKETLQALIALSNYVYPL